VSRGRARGAVAGFLAAYVSRYTDHDGYWLFGYLAAAEEIVKVDLLDERPRDTGPTGSAARIARARFLEHLAKARVDVSEVQTASLEITPLSVSARVRVGRGDVVDGRGLRVSVRIVLESGARVAREVTVFAAPHDPTRELRSTRRAS
jgi:hypothetical protein